MNLVKSVTADKKVSKRIKLMSIGLTLLIMLMCLKVYVILNALLIKKNLNIDLEIRKQIVTDNKSVNNNLTYVKFISCHNHIFTADKNVSLNKSDS